MVLISFVRNIAVQGLVARKHSFAFSTLTGQNEVTLVHGEFTRSRWFGDIVAVLGDKQAWVR